MIQLFKASGWIGKSALHQAPSVRFGSGRGARRIIVRSREGCRRRLSHLSLVIRRSSVASQPCGAEAARRAGREELARDPDGGGGSVILLSGAPRNRKCDPDIGAPHASRFSGSQTQRVHAVVSLGS